MSFKQMAVATDFSPGADVAFEKTLEMASSFQAKVLVAYVLPSATVFTPLLDDISVSEMTTNLRQRLRESAESRLTEHYLDRCAALGIEAEGVLLEGDPAKALVEMAQSRQIDLLVVGSTGLSGLAEAFFGSVAAKVVRRAECSVIVVRKPPDPLTMV